MSWVTIVWSMVASACLTLAAIYFLVWCKKRTAWAHLLFSVTAASTTGFAFCELLMMRARTPAELGEAMRWGQLALFFLLLSITWFVRIYLGAGRPWLAWTITGLRSIYVLIPFVAGINVNYLEVGSVRRIQFLGESVTVLGGVPNPLSLFGHFGVLMIVVCVADAGVTAWRRGDRRKALMVGGSVEFLLLAGLGTSLMVIWGDVQAPIVISQCYLVVLAVMAYELSREVLRASQLVGDLQTSEAGLRESEARMSLAVDVADFGIWITDLSRNEIWASDRWREMFGFTPSESVEFDAVLGRVHPDDREGFEQAHATAVAGADGSTYQMEFRLLLPDGATRWISSRGRSEHDAAGKPTLIRGASRDDTARKCAELAVRNLSGRLLRAQEEERRRIARELHDNLAQLVALLAVDIDQLAMTPESGTGAVGLRRQLRTRAADLSTEIHNLSHRLHSTKLEVLGLEAAVQGLCRELRAQGLQVQCLVENLPRGLSDEVALCLFRIVQEALNNVVKHSDAHQADVTLSATRGALLLRIADFGRGFDEAAAAGREGLGLASMRERMRLIGGDVAIRSRVGEGTTVDARVPLQIPGGESTAARGTSSRVSA